MPVYHNPPLTLPTLLIPTDITKIKHTIVWGGGVGGGRLGKARGFY